jgi:hypothetical protein
MAIIGGLTERMKNLRAISFFTAFRGKMGPCVSLLTSESRIIISNYLYVDFFEVLLANNQCPPRRRDI